MGLFVGVANSCMYLDLASLFLSDGFLLYGTRHKKGNAKR